MLLPRAHCPLATPPPVVRDEEAAGSNPVTPTVFPQVRALTRVGEGPSCCLYRNEIPQVPQQIRTFDLLIERASPARAALRWDEEAAWSKRPQARKKCCSEVGKLVMLGPSPSALMA